jgi:hypothetical protein
MKKIANVAIMIASIRSGWAIDPLHDAAEQAARRQELITLDAKLKRKWNKQIARSAAMHERFKRGLSPWDDAPVRVEPAEEKSFLTTVQTKNGSYASTLSPAETVYIINRGGHNIGCAGLDAAEVACTIAKKYGLPFGGRRTRTHTVRSDTNRATHGARSALLHTSLAGTLRLNPKRYSPSGSETKRPSPPARSTDTVTPPRAVRRSISMPVLSDAHEWRMSGTSTRTPPAQVMTWETRPIARLSYGVALDRRPSSLPSSGGAVLSAKPVHSRSVTVGNSGRRASADLPAMSINQPTKSRGKTGLVRSSRRSNVLGWRSRFGGRRTRSNGYGLRARGWGSSAGRTTTMRLPPRSGDWGLAGSARRW